MSGERRCENCGIRPAVKGRFCWACQKAAERRRLTAAERAEQLRLARQRKADRGGPGLPANRPYSQPTQDEALW